MIPSHVFIGVMIPCRALTSKLAKLFAKKGLFREISADDQKNFSTHFSQFFTHRLVDLQNDQNLEEMFNTPPTPVFFFFLYLSIPILPDTVILKSGYSCNVKRLKE